MLGWMLIPLYEKMDAVLERYGGFDSVQRFRLSVVDYYLKHNPKLKNFKLEELLDDILKVDLALRYVLQNEEFLKQEYQTLKVKASTIEDKEKLKYFLRCQDRLSKNYWLLERELYKAESLLPSGPFRRAYDTWRSNPKWYLHPDLTNDCAGRGGCCGRRCGCCEKREPTPERRRGVGHCTIECICCSEARGFELSSTDADMDWEKATMSILSAFESPSNMTYYSRYMRSFFTGMESKMEKAPEWI